LASDHALAAASRLEAAMAPAHEARDTIPDKVDMRASLWPVEHVGDLSASAASAAVTALEYHCNRIDVEPTNLSTMFVYYNARLASGQEHLNSGVTLEAAMKAIETYGACRDASWPLDAAKLSVRPPPQAYDEAKRFAAVHCYHTPDGVDALALSYPVAFVATFPERCLHAAGDTGVMPAPTPEERQRTHDWMTHAMVLVGYDKVAKTFIARNCWGPEFGVEGHCTITFDTLSVIVPSGEQRLWVIAKPAASATAVNEAAAAAPPERLADLAARMREDIRSDLQRDIADATKRARDMIRNPGGQRDVGTRACFYCGGSGLCGMCAGAGCGACGGKGRCQRCL
jgi:hypothetical protein